MYATLSRAFAGLAIVALLACASPVVSLADILFAQTNLTSDIPGLAANTDPNMKNPWGVSFSQTSPFWVSDRLLVYLRSITPQASRRVDH
jgi:hypothetical protein